MERLGLVRQGIRLHDLPQQLHNFVRPIQQQAQAVEHIAANDDFVPPIIAHDFNARETDRVKENVNPMHRNAANAVTQMGPDIGGVSN